MKRKLSIVYDGPADFDLEQGLKEVAEVTGWIWYREGTELTTGKRDLAFYKKGGVVVENGVVSREQFAALDFYATPKEVGIVRTPGGEESIPPPSCEHPYRCG